MIEDVPFKQFLALNGVHAPTVQLGDTYYGAVRIARGRLVVDRTNIVPVVENKTSYELFVEFVKAKAEYLLADPPPSRGALSSALLLRGSPNYYHFLVYHLPALLLLGLFPEGARVSLAISYAIPATIEAALGDLIAMCAGNRKVERVKLEDFVYDVENIALATARQGQFASVFHRAVTLPHLIGKVDAPADLKLFIRRGAATRRLANEAEVETWFTAHGYDAVDPGALSFADQALLFARATHIAGVEGAALANLVFAVRAKSVLMLSSVLAESETFFPSLVTPYGTKFRVVSGAFVPGQAPSRNADFSIPLDRIAAAHAELAG